MSVTIVPTLEGIVTCGCGRTWTIDLPVRRSVPTPTIVPSWEDVAHRLEAERLEHVATIEALRAEREDARELVNALELVLFTIAKATGMEPPGGPMLRAKIAEYLARFAPTAVQTITRQP